MPTFLASIDLTMVAFIFATTAFPGPNAVLMLTIGSRIGVVGGLPILIGMAIGNAAVKGVTAAGMRWAASLDPHVIETAQWAAIALLVWFTFRILRRSGPLRAAAAGDGIAVSGVSQAFDGFGFQLSNPKVWVTGFAAAALFCTPELDELGHALAFSTVAFPAVVIGAGVWLVAGRYGSRWLSGPRTVRFLNVTLVVVLALAAIPVVMV